MPNATTTRFTITEPQKGLLAVDGWVPTREIYNQIIRFDLDPELPEDRVERALVELVTLQPALRQVFGRLPDASASLLPPPLPADLPLERVDAAPGRYTEAADALAQRLGERPFDLHTGPAYRLGHVRAAEGDAAAILLCGHHIVGDGVSMGPMIRDLSAGLTGELDPDAVRKRRAQRETAFLREIEAQNRASGSPRTAERTRDWAKSLREVPPLVLAPRPDRPAETEFSGSRLSWTLSEDETAELYRTCKRLSITPFVLLTAVYGTVLARHGGVSTVLVGSPFTARRTIGAFDLCGFFVNTLPVTVDVDWGRTVDEHLAVVVRDAVDHCRGNVDVNFTQLVAEVGQARDGNRNPLFSCMLAMQDTFDTESAGPIVGVREPGNGTAKFDLWLGATPVGGRWLLELEHDRELIAPAIADGLLDSLRTALRRTLSDGSRTLADLFEDAPAPPVAEAPEEKPGETLAALVDAAARRAPDAVAVAEPGNQVSHGELADAAERAAGGLVRHGVAAGDVVGLAVDTLVDAVTAMLAILRCGATYLPLDPSLPPERLATMVRTAECRVVAGAGIDLPGVRTVGLADLTTTGAPAPAKLGDPDVAPYLMFTSGSSGTPKGVLMGHRPLLNLAAWQKTALRHDSGTRFLQYAPLGFDVSFQEILPTLAAGGTVVSREPADRRDFRALAERVAETEVTHVFLPVAALRPFVQAATVRFPALRFVCVSGEQLLVDDEIREFFVRHPDCTLVNLYGPTETNAATTFRLSGADADWPGHVPIGRPLPGVAAYVVDQTGHLAPPGVPGELWLGGRSPADGYFGDPARTAAAFLPDRFADEGRLYRTGDQVVRDEHGTLTFLGRRDDQIKIRGHRVELGEIETVARAEAGVRQAVAVATGTGAERELVLFLLGTNGIAPDHEATRARLTRLLPAHMVPARIFDVDRIPTSGTGKTDRAALAELAGRLISEHHGVEHATPTEYADELERGLAGLWADVLNTEGIVRDRSLLEYGAHSLNVFTAFARIEQEYGVAIGVSEFFRMPTVAGVADQIRAKARETA